MKTSRQGPNKWMVLAKQIHILVERSGKIVHCIVVPIKHRWSGMELWHRVTGLPCTGGRADPFRLCIVCDVCSCVSLLSFAGEARAV